MAGTPAGADRAGISPGHDFRLQPGTTGRPIVRRAVEDAKAREWLARYLVGTPETVAPRLFDMTSRPEPVENATSERRRFNALFGGWRFCQFW